MLTYSFLFCYVLFTFKKLISKITPQTLLKHIDPRVHTALVVAACTYCQ